MHHAVGTFLIPRGPIVIPDGCLHEFTERFGIAVLEQITRLLPAKYVVGRIAPGRALVLPPAHQKIQEERRLIELPARFRFPENTRKEFARALTL